MVDSRTMRPTCTAIQLFRRGTRVIGPAWVRAAVSLYSHSDRSQEKLDFVPGIARRIPVVARFFERAVATDRRVHGRDLDFSSAYWRPPLPPSAVIASEREQIERRFDCRALVSLTDHDTIEGPRDTSREWSTRRAAVSGMVSAIRRCDVSPGGARHRTGASRCH
jgi:hypothetical protein